MSQDKSRDMLSDEQLVEAYIRTNDEAYFTPLYTRHRARLLALLRQGVCRNDEGLAQDALQLTFVSVKDNLLDFDPALRFSAWVTQIAVRKGVDVRRRHRKCASIQTHNFTDYESAQDSGGYYDGLTYPTEPQDKVTPTAQEAVWQKELIAQVANVIATLPEDYQAAIQAHYFEGLTGEDVAEKLNLPIGTVWIYLHRARKLMRARLERMDISGAA